MLAVTFIRDMYSGGVFLGSGILVGTFTGYIIFNRLLNDTSDYEQCILNTTIQKVEEE